MTGFGTAEEPVGGRRLKVELRSVNHRFFNPSIRLPGDLASLESEVREALKRAFDRGHVSLSARWVDDGAGRAEGMFLQPERIRAAADALRVAQRELGLAGAITMDQLLRVPGLFADRGEGQEPAAAWKELEPAVAAAISACRMAREREGAALAADIAARVETIGAGAARIAEQAPARLEREARRLAESVRKLAEGIDVDPARVAAEVAVLADRIDVTEELVRLRSHLAAVAGLLEAGGPVGKQLGFIAQEIGREVNTIGSKANDALISREVIAMKGELEKIREQLENLE